MSDFWLTRLIFKDFPLDFFPEVDIMNENWAYTRLSEEVRGIKALYGAFRRFQKQQTTTGRVPSPQRAWTDLAETILEDPKSSVIDSLFSIYELSLRNDLFNKTRKVMDASAYFYKIFNDLSDFKQ